MQQLTRIMSEYHDKSPEAESLEIYWRFRSELVLLATSGQYEQIVESNVYREPGREGNIIQIVFVVKDPVYKAVAEADKIVEQAAVAAGVKLVDPDHNTEDAVGYEADGITVVPA